MQDGVWPHLTVVAACSPYFVAAVLRLVLHMLKKPVPPPDGSSVRPMRPGTPFNPVHPVILMLACRADGLNSVSWTATFWPLWTVFGMLGIASIAASILAVGILVARDPPDHGQRALFFLCYAFLLTVTTTGLVFLIALSERLDGNTSVSYELIITPLIVGYSLLLLFYLVFTIFLPPLLLRDLNAAALADDDAEAAEEEGGVSGVIEAVSQQLAPPVLVQHSSTLFRRMGNSAMFERFLPISSSVAPHDPAASAAPATPVAPAEPAPPTATAGTVGDLALTDLEAGGSPMPIARAPKPADSADGAGGGTGTLGALRLEEYDALEKDIELWVRTQQQQQQRNRTRKPRPARGKAATAPAAPDSTLVPADVKAKLRRLMSLKEQLAAAACAEACGASFASASLADAKPAAKVLPTAAPATPAAPVPGAGALSAAAAANETVTLTLAPASPARQAAGADAGLAAADSDVLELTSAPPSPMPFATPPRRRQLVVRTAAEDSAEGGGDEGGDADDGDGGAESSLSAPACVEIDGSDDDDEDALCAICFTGPRDAVLLECGHGGICYACARRCLRKKGRECPMCRTPVEQVVQIRLDGAPSSPQHTGVVRVKQAGLPDEISLG
jgi:hypothetical protein